MVCSATESVTEESGLAQLERDVMMIEQAATDVERGEQVTHSYHCTQSQSRGRNSLLSFGCRHSTGWGKNHLTHCLQLTQHALNNCFNFYFHFHLLLLYL